MIKFFRRIRQQLLSENKFSKYLIYAIGEIILVMIGILLALQVNNWNDLRKGKSETNKILIELSNEIKKDRETALSFTAINQGRIVNSLHLSDFLFQKNIVFDTLKLKKAFIETNRVEYFIPKKAAYQTLVNSGLMNNINDITLKNALIDYYELTVFEEQSIVQLNDYTGEYANLRFKYFPQHGLKDEIMATSKSVKGLNKFYNALKLPLDKIKLDTTLRIALEKVIGVNQAVISLSMKRRIKEQDALLKLLDEYVNK